MGFSPSRIIYDLLAPLRLRTAPRGATQPAGMERPAGQLVWIHATRANDFPVIFDLVGNLADEHPEAWFLLTSDGARPDELPDQCLHMVLPPDTRSAAADFLAHWRPDVALWITGRLRPALVREASLAGVPLFMLDTGAAIETTRGWRILPGLVRGSLRLFDTILSGDEATSLALISAGAHRDRVITTGVLQRDIDPLPCNQAEWDDLAATMSTRPIWLAAEIDRAELESVLAAHGQATRRSHRLLLILVPADPDWGDEFASLLAEKGFVFARRSTGGEPDLVTQVYLADTDEEMGLWYRLAPVSFIGQTLAGGAGTGPNPFDAAALGSVVLHGPLTQGHRLAYERLGRAGASREINHMGELAHVLEMLIAPDRAAVMAHAAWQISSAGAEVMEKSVTMLTRALDGEPPEALVREAMAEAALIGDDR